MPTPRPTVSRMALAACMLTLTLSACQKSASDNGQPATAPPIAALALATATPPTPIAYAPAATALPSGSGHIRFGLTHDRGRYSYTDRAYAMSNAFGDTPPDYTVDYDGTRPWIWRSDDGGYRVVEQLPDGQRTYYYARGADQPFYITDPDGGYAYNGGMLVAVYGPDGSPLPDSYAQQRADNAERYYDRSIAIYHAAQYSQRQAAYADDWRARRDGLAQQQQRWNDERTRDSDWAAWHDQHQQDEDGTWRAEHDRRNAYAATIGAAVVGAAVFGSGNHSDGDQNRGAPPAQTNGPGYGQRPNNNPPPAGYPGAARVQQQPAPAAQYTGARPAAPQLPQRTGLNGPQGQPQRQAPRAMPPVPAHVSMPIHQTLTVRPSIAPIGASVVGVRAPMRPQAPLPPVRMQPLAQPRIPAASIPVRPVPVVRPAPEVVTAHTRWSAPANVPRPATAVPAGIPAPPRPVNVAPVQKADPGHHAPNRDNGGQRAHPRGQPATGIPPRI